jgi:hypothetical protein
MPPEAERELSRRDFGTPALEFLRFLLEKMPQIIELIKQVTDLFADDEPSTA